MPSLHPYLNFKGTTEEAFNFYKSVFGGEFATLMRFSEAPGTETLPEHLKSKIMHIALPIGNSMLMATDALEEMGQTLTQGSNMYISVNADSMEDGKRLFDALSAGGKVEMPFEKQFWGSHFGSLIDKFGIPWMMSFDERTAG
jgi:PhnB protein